VSPLRNYCRKCFNAKCTVSLVIGLGLLVMGTASASAGGSPKWAITSSADPSHFTPGSSKAAFVITATNVGDAATSGPIVVADTLPAGTDLTPVEIFGTDAYRLGIAVSERLPLACNLGTLSCSFTEPVDPGDSLTIVLQVTIAASPSAHVVTNHATVSGGGTASAVTTEATSKPTPLEASPVPFGMSGFFSILSRNLADSHPNITTSVFINQRIRGVSAGSTRDVSVILPLGLVGNPTATPRCTADSVARFECPADTAVGVATSSVNINPTEFSGQGGPFVSLIYNIVPYTNEPAAFAFNTIIAPTRLDTAVRRGADGQYRTYVTASSIVEIGSVISALTTFWGVPAEHNGPGLASASPSPNLKIQSFGGPSSGAAVPFLTAPEICAGDPLTEGLLPLTSTAAVDVWQAPGATSDGVPDLSDANWRSAAWTSETATGCERVPFTPSIEALPDTFRAGAPAGYVVDLHVSQGQSPSEPSSPKLQNAVVTLPPGTVVSPSAANGLEACSDEPSDPRGDQFALSSPSTARCPPASQIGTVKITTPLLASPLEGQVFVGSPRCSPCSANDAREGRMIRIFLQAHGSGVNIKLEGSVAVDQATGELTTTFDNNPQFPFEDVRLALNGGSEAAVANPTTCGRPIAATAQLTPYNSPVPAQPSGQLFAISGCPAPQFAPAFNAGTINNQAGAFSLFTTTFGRIDGEQGLSGVQITTPPGLLGELSKVPLCGEPQAREGKCTSASQIGTTTVGAGPGTAPVYLPVAGQPPNPVYLTTGYHGAPFGLSVVVPAIAGPFNLGTVVVRAAVNVNPINGQITVTSDPLPQILDGVPLRLRTVNVSINREGFIFNPTNCAKLVVNGTLASTEGTSAAVTSSFQAANCGELPFKPNFSASTQGNGGSRGNGASLDVKISAPRQGPSSNPSTLPEANIAKVDVQLPLALPSRLKTLQKACTERQFGLNPAGCPEESDVGTAVAHTPVLPVPLEGPAYLVSHGGAAFPDLDIVLQGDGVVIILTGSTDIKRGLTFSRFEAVPDAPISSFELKLPERPYSALAAYGNLCKLTTTRTVARRFTRQVHGRVVHGVRRIAETVATPLLMPTKITAQSGAVLEQVTRIAVTGCSKPKAGKAGKARKASHHHGPRGG
jgi:uncharacterized repeat protein (TIGR01451 family)